MEIGKIIELRKELHNNPEIGLKLNNSKKILIDFIKNNTSKVEVIDMDFYFYCIINKELNSNPIAFRADYDALSLDGNIGHYCGHDGHASVAVGLIMELDKINTSRTIYVIFQPGEEDGSGAKLISPLVKEKGIKEIYAFHNIPGYKENSIIVLDDTFACISTGLEIKLKGSVSHAAYPNLGANPANAISKIVLYTDEYIKQKNNKLLLSTVIGIDLGSSSYGVSAGSGTLRLTIRSNDKSDFDNLINEISLITKEYAKEDKLEYEINKIDEFPLTKNTLSKNVINAATKLNLDVIKPKEPFRWSEDFGYFLYESKGAMFGIGVGENYSGLHKIDYEFNDNIISTAIKMFINLI